MNCADVIAEILKREGVEFVFGYPSNLILEAAAKVDIRPVISRQERTGLHMADALSRISSGQRIGVFAMQHGPGCENAFGGVAQAYADSVPILVLPGGYPRHLTNIPPNFNSFINFRHITKSLEQVTMPSVIPDALRRAFSQVKNGRPRPVLVEFPTDLLREELSGNLDYTPAIVAKTSADPVGVKEVARVLVNATRPVIYAGQGVHYARAWTKLRDLAELLAATVATSLPGKSAFPENHPLSIGTCGRTFPRTARQFIRNSDVIFGSGCSFSSTVFGMSMPPGKLIIHATLDPADLNKDIRADLALIGDADLILGPLISEIGTLLKGKRRESGRITAEIRTEKERWLHEWMPKLTSTEVPISPYRVIWDLMHTVDRANTIITHDAGSPRDQLSPFWETIAPLTYLGWGKSTQLGYGLGLALGSKLAKPNQLSINFMGDAAIGMTGMDFETAVRAQIPILTILSNNSCMTIELDNYPVGTQKYRMTDISGNYAEMARAFGGYGERVTQPSEIISAIKRGIQKTKEGVPALLEFITSKETQFSI